MDLYVHEHKCGAKKLKDEEIVLWGLGKDKKELGFMFKSSFITYWPSPWKKSDFSN